MKAIKVTYTHLGVISFHLTLLLSISNTGGALVPVPDPNTGGALVSVPDPNTGGALVSVLRYIKGWV